MKLDILVFAAHPDDAELGCGGTIIQQIEAGKKVGIIDLTQGELGTRGDVETREKEAQKANEVMGVMVRENLQMADGFFSHSSQNLLKVVEMVRKYRPDMVLANSVTDRHPDHGKGAKLVSEACFLSGLVKVETSIKGKWQEKWRPKNVFHYVQDRFVEPDFVVDISSVFEKKMEAIKSYSSQFYNPDVKGENTPISSKEFWFFLEARAREFGRSVGAEFGEGFVSDKKLGVKDIWTFL
ncbi:MAG: bacillithiol biosynthesis deacetylase BshB1 [Bacteroidota bacterium]